MKSSMLKPSLLFGSALVSVAVSSVGNAQSTTPVEMLKPIRQTTGRVKIMKSEIRKLPSGEYQWSSATVCQKDIVIDVYDGRGKRSYGYANNANVECETAIAGVTSTLKGAASIIFRDQSIFDGEAVGEVRSNHIRLESTTGGGTANNNFIATAEVLTRDLNTSAIVTADQGLNWDCSSGKCQAVGEETFTATVEFGP